jgi:hypothetical protein
MKVYNKHGMAKRNGTDMFPREVMNRFPLLPLEEEGRLNDMPLRENFIERVFGLRRRAWLSAWQFACGKLHDRMDGDAGLRTHARRPGQVPLRPQTHPHGPQPILTEGRAIIPRWAASSQTPAIATGRDGQPSIGPCSWKASV